MTATTQPVSRSTTPTTAIQADIVRVAARAFEVDRYLSALLAPVAARDDLLALAAFAGEIGRIPLIVTEPMMGRIRFQWWRDVIENRADGGNPIASAFISAANRHELETAAVIRFIDAHELTLDDAPFADDEALRAHFAATEGLLLACAVTLLGPGVNLADMDHPEHIAATNAYGMARLLAELPATLAAGRVLIPRAQLSANHLTPDTVLAAAAGNTPQWRALLGDLVASARLYNQTSAATLAALPATHRSALYPLALVESYLRASVSGQSVQPLERIRRLWFARCFGRVWVTPA
jgi:15-cis-phytoene synthase